MGGREAVGVVPCADPGSLSTRVGARHDRSEIPLLSQALPVRSRLWERAHWLQQKGEAACQSKSPNGR